MYFEVIKPVTVSVDGVLGDLNGGENIDNYAIKAGETVKQMSVLNHQARFEYGTEDLKIIKFHMDESLVGEFFKPAVKK